MIIAINLTRNTTAIGSYNFLIDCCTHIALAKSNYFFVFISNQTIVLPKSLPNIQCIVLPQKFSNSISAAYWYYYTLPAAIKKCKANVLVHIDGVATLKINIPQCTFANEIESNTATLYTSNFIKKKQALFFNKVAAIFVQTSISKAYIQQQFSLDANKIHVVLPGLNQPNKTTSWQQQQAIKEQYTSGVDYFLHVSNLTQTNAIINILKAFTLFKKRQKSNMKLVLLANNLASNNEVINSLQLYKHKADIVVLIDESSMVINKITTAAYACIQTEYHQNNFTQYLHIMGCNVPLIVAENIHTNEILQQAALYVNNADVQAIAQAMMLLFTNEGKRNDYIQAATILIKQYSWHKTANSFLQHITAIDN